MHDPCMLRPTGQARPRSHPAGIDAGFGRCPSHRLFKTFVHVVEPVKSPYNAVVRRELGRTRAQAARTGRSRFPVRSAAKTALPARRNGTSQMTSLDSFKCARTLKVGTKSYIYYSLPVAEKNGLKGISRLPFSMKVLLENLLRNEDGRTRQQGRHPGLRAMAQDQDLGTRDRVPPGARADAGFHRRPRRGRPRCDAGRDEAPRRRSQADQPAGAGRSRHRPFGRHHLLRRQRGIRKERRRGIQAECRALSLPEMGAGLVRGLPRGASRHRHLPSGQSRISLADRVHVEGHREGRRQDGDRRGGLSRHGGRHRFPHHHGQRPRRARLGRRRHRGGSRHAGPALFDGACRR